MVNVEELNEAVACKFTLSFETWPSAPEFCPTAAYHSPDSTFQLISEFSVFGPPISKSISFPEQVIETLVWESGSHL